MTTANEKFWDRCVGIIQRFTQVCDRRFDEAKSDKERRNILHGRIVAHIGQNVNVYRETLRKANETLG